MDYKFRIEFLEEAKEFLDGLDEKSRDKIVYNIWKSRSTNDKELFKKLQDEIWELEQNIIKHIIGFLHFGTSWKKMMPL